MRQLHFFMFIPSLDPDIFLQFSEVVKQNNPSYFIKEWFNVFVDLPTVQINNFGR